MKNLSRIFTLVLGTMIITSGLAMAESTQFTPLNFDDSTAIRTTTTTSSTASSSVLTGTSGNTMLDPSQVTGGTKMQNAILQLDNAQIEVRNQLLNYKTNYEALDAQLKQVKADRKAAKKQVKQAEKRIKNLDKAKSKIRKNFEQKINM